MQVARKAFHEGVSDDLARGLHLCGDVYYLNKINRLGCRMTWHVVYTAAHHEPVAESGIRALGFKTFLPTIIRMVTLRGRRKPTPVERSLFPRYLFAHFTLADHWQPILSTNGVEMILTGAAAGSGLPAPVSDSVMAMLFEAQAAGWETAHEIMAAAKAGDIMRILAGPFTGQAVRVGSVDGQKSTAKVGAFLFGRSVAVDIPLAELEKL